MGATQTTMQAGPASACDTRKKVLVTGGSGLLGRPLVKELTDRSFAVSSLTARSWHNNHPRVQALFKELGVTSYMLDLSIDVEQAGQGLRELIRSGGFDLVINLAADRGGVKFDGATMLMNSPTLNTQLPACLSSIAAEEGVPVFLISTEYVWTGRDNTEDGYPAVPVGTDDRFVKKAGAPYAVQKHMAEALAEERRVQIPSGDSITIIRLPVLYGELISPLEDGTATASIHNFLTENSWKHDTWQRRYPTYAGDAASAIAALARKRLSEGLLHPVYNYGAQTTMSKFDFMAMFAREADLPVECVQQQDASLLDEKKRPPFDVRLDIRQTRQELEHISDWCEPRQLDGSLIRELFFGMFAEGIRCKRTQLDNHISESTLARTDALFDPTRRERLRSSATFSIAKTCEPAHGEASVRSKPATNATASPVWLPTSAAMSRFQEFRARHSHSAWRLKHTSQAGCGRTWLRQHVPREC